MATETDYLARLLAGDSTALDRLYREQFPVIRALIGEHGGAETDAWDVFQDALLIVFRKAKAPDFLLTSQFSTYFYSICRNVWFNRRTKKSATSEVTLSEDTKYTVVDEPSQEADLLFVERGNLFWKAFHQLGNDCQKLLELFFQKIPMETIAEQMGYGSEDYAKTRKRQCKNRLVELVKNDPAFLELRFGY